MDSMRHLSTSLPPAAGRRRRPEPPQELLGSFKEAALSVTNLYKAAASAQSKARAAGYQDALDDLLVFLDHENLGLMDGEGWRVRQWATERLDDDMVQRQAAGSDDEDDGSMENNRSTSPEVIRKAPHVAPAAPDTPEEETKRTDASESPEHNTSPQTQTSSNSTPAQTTPLAPQNYNFSFRSQNAYPSNHDRDGNGTMDLDDSSPPSSIDSVRVHSRPNRQRHPTRARGNGSSLNLNLGSGAGNKRKAPVPDFFDLSDFKFEQYGDNKRDGNGRGGKRGRHV